MSRICISTPTRLNVIHRMIHDCWFDVDDISFDKDRSLLAIPFKKEIRHPRHGVKRSFFFRVKAQDVVKWTLVFGNVVDYVMDDTERVGSYDFNEIKYDPINRTFTITTGIPLGFHIHVTDFSVGIEK